LNDAKKQSVFPLLGLLYDVEQFKSGEPVSVADVRINEVRFIYAFSIEISRVRIYHGFW